MFLLVVEVGKRKRLWLEWEIDCGLYVCLIGFWVGGCYVVVLVDKMLWWLMSGCDVGWG